MPNRYPVKFGYVLRPQYEGFFNGGTARWHDLLASKTRPFIEFNPEAALSAVHDQVHRVLAAAG